MSLKEFLKLLYLNDKILINNNLHKIYYLSENEITLFAIGCSKNYFFDEKNVAKVVVFPNYNFEIHLVNGIIPLFGTVLVAEPQKIKMEQLNEL